MATTFSKVLLIGGRDIFRRKTIDHLIRSNDYFPRVTNMVKKAVIFGDSDIYPYSTPHTFYYLWDLPNRHLLSPQYYRGASLVVSIGKVDEWLRKDISLRLPKILPIPIDDRDHVDSARHLAIILDGKYPYPVDLPLYHMNNLS